MNKIDISLNYLETDTKYNLLEEIFNIVDARKVIQIFTRNNVKNTTMFSKYPKIMITSIFFTSKITHIVNEANRAEELAKFLGL